MKNDDLKKWHVDTRLIRTANKVDFSQVRSHIPPIFQTVNFDYENVADGLSVFTGEKSGYFYTRESNPTSELFAHMITVIEEGRAGIAVASGMAAISSAVLAFVEPGDEIVSSSTIYGGTKAWFTEELASINVSTRFVDITNTDSIKKAINSRTKILFTEVLGNPNLAVADITAMVQIAKENNLIFIIDSTFTPPPIIQALKFGADVVIHSATKYIGGHGDIIGGVLVSHSEEYIEKIRKTVKLYGGVISPFNAWLGIRGLKTLAIRLERHCSNAMAIAEFLHQHPKVEHVYYPGLPSHPQHSLAKAQLSAFGGMLAFEIKGGFNAGKEVMDAVQVCNFTVSLGEIDTLIMHPASTSHVSLSEEERNAIGVTEGMMRLSVGIENVDDLIADLDQALDQI